MPDFTIDHEFLTRFANFAYFYLAGTGLYRLSIEFFPLISLSTIRAFSYIHAEGEDGGYIVFNNLLSILWSWTEITTINDMTIEYLHGVLRIFLWANGIFIDPNTNLQILINFDCVNNYQGSRVAARPLFS